MCSSSILLAITRLTKQFHHCGCVASMHLQKKAPKQSELTHERMQAITTPDPHQIQVKRYSDQQMISVL